MKTHIVLTICICLSLVCGASALSQQVFSGYIDNTKINDNTLIKVVAKGARYGSTNPVPIKNNTFENLILNGNISHGTPYHFELIGDEEHTLSINYKDSLVWYTEGYFVENSSVDVILKQFNLNEPISQTVVSQPISSKIDLDSNFTKSPVVIETLEIQLFQSSNVGGNTVIQNENIVMIPEKKSNDIFILAGFIAAITLIIILYAIHHIKEKEDEDDILR